MCGAKCKEAKAASKIQSGMTWPKYESAGSKYPKARGRRAFAPFKKTNATGRNTEGVGETNGLADALCSHRVRRAAGQLRCARYSARTGPYDAIFDKQVENRAAASED